MNPLIEWLAPAIDNATYIDLFTYTLLLIPTLFIVPLVIYHLILKPASMLRKLL